MNARNWIKMGEATIDGFEAIQKITHLGGGNDEAALKAIKAVLSAIEDGFSRGATPQEVKEHIATIHDRFVGNDAAALEELHKKYPAP